VGQKVHPYGFRLGVYEDWKSHWFAKKQYGRQFIEDVRIRKFLNKHLHGAEISKIVIDKAGESIRAIIHSSRPGIVIGKKGQNIENLRALMIKEFNKKIDVSVQEIKDQELDAQIVAQSIASQLERRAGYKRVMKKAGHLTMKAGAKGIKICCSGRLAGAEIARIEWIRLGSVRLHTLRARVDYANVEAKTTYGMIGVKVWISKGEY